MQNRRHRSTTSIAKQHASTPLAILRYRPVLVLTLFVLAGVYLFTRGSTEPTVVSSEAKVAGVQAVVKKVQQAPFPTINTSSFTTSQQRMLSLMKEEYAKQPISFDANVLVYTEGFKESWCADFVSWVRLEAGKPLINPETGYWRIPGVQSLRDYYASSDAYYFIGTYTPKFGDVAFYFGETPDGTNREHVAFVLEVRGDTLVTLGGNETSKGLLQIRTNKLVEGERGLSAFGKSTL